MRAEKRQMLPEEEAERKCRRWSLNHQVTRQKPMPVGISDAKQRLDCAWDSGTLVVAGNLCRKPG